MPFTRTAAIYTVPDLTLGLTNVQGSSDGIRADASIAIFDATVPTTAAASDAAATGSAAITARRDHVHGMPASFTTFAAPSFTLGTSNVTGTGDTVHAGATLLAFDATLPDSIAYGQAGAVGVATVASRRDHSHQMAASATLQSVLEGYVEDGTKEVLYMLGAPQNAALAHGDKVGLGGQWLADIVNVATITPSTTIRGGWQMYAIGSGSSAALYAGGATLDAASDWTIVIRANVVSGLIFDWGLAATPTGYRPRNNNNVICMEVHDSEALYLVTDNAGTETETNAAAGVTGVHTFRIDITEGGTNVDFYMDDALEGSHTTNIPSASVLYMFMSLSAFDASAKYVHVADCFAWRDV